MIKFLLLILILASMRAFAGYRCELSLAHTDDIDNSLVEKAIETKTGSMISNVQNSFIDQRDSKSPKILKLNYFINGRLGEEEASFVISQNANDKSEKVELRGRDEATFWYDSYKIDISCDLR